MPRIAAHCLLALLLCLNGFLAPFAMAGHAQVLADETAQSAPCHGGDAADDGTPADESSPRKHDGSGCCKPGHCACAQTAAAPQTITSTIPVATASRIAAVMTDARSDAPRAVALRPPIV